MARLGDIFKIQSGGTPDKKHPEYYTPSEIPWVKTGDLRGKYITSEIEFISKSGLKNSSAKVFPEGTVLIAMYGATIGACSILPFEASTNQACAAFLPNERALPEYLYYFLCSKKQQFTKDGVGGAQPNISAGYLSNVKVTLPSIPVQQKVAYTLTIVDELISLRKKQLKKLDDLVKSRFVEMFGDPKVNEMCWEEGIIADYFEVKGGKRIPKGMDYAEGITNHPYLRATDMKNETILDDDIHYIGEDVYQHIKRYTVKGGDIYLTNVGVNLGMAGVVPEKYSGANLTENAVKLVPKTDRFRGIFVANYINSPGIQDYIKERKMAVGVPKLAIFRIETMPLIIPPVEKQDEFATFRIQVDKSKLTVQQGLDKLELLKQSLMQKYFG